MIRPRTMRAVVADPAQPGILHVREVPVPPGDEGDVLVRVEAFSLNAGDTRSALAAQQWDIPGWDFAGSVESPGSSGLTPGTRVAGFASSGAWAQYVAAPAANLAVLPDDLDCSRASALPVAGLTALFGLRIGGDLSGRRVLITGAAGGVGRYACQLAHASTADLHAVSRRPGIGELLASDGVGHVTIHPTIEAATSGEGYDFILDSVGGRSLALALAALNPRGTVVNCGNSSGAPTTFDVRDMYLKGGTALHGFFLGHSAADGAGGRGLAELVAEVSAGRLHVPISQEMTLDEIAEAAARLTSQQVEGKIVIRPW